MRWSGARLFPEEVWQHLTNMLPDGSFLLGLSSILWREAWKYGERAFRYCQHDIGHALAALRFSAVLCGWDLQLVQGWSTVDVAMLLGLDRSDEFFDEEREEAELLCIVGPGLASQDELVFVPPAEGIRHQIRDATWHGRANRLSKEHAPVAGHRRGRQRHGNAEGRPLALIPKSISKSPIAHDSPKR